MKKQIPVIVLGVVCIALLIGYAGQKKTIKLLRGDIDSLKSRASTTASENKNEEVVPTPSSVEQLSGQSNPLVDGFTAPSAPEPPDSVDESQIAGRKLMEGIAEMLDNPTVSEMVKASQRGALNTLYADLIGYLNLNQEESEFFMDLLMNRQMVQTQVGLKMMSSGITEEESAALALELEQSQVLFEEQMREFLNNDDDYAEYEYYENTMTERSALSQMDEALAGTGAELSDQVYRDLVGVMYDERENFPFTSDLHDEDNTDLSPERFSSENVQNFVNDLEALNEQVFQKAKPMLTQEQYDAFVQSVGETTEMQVTQLKLAAQLLGAGN
ncbi:MAG: hypothetical protein JXR23_06425 [Pontiellaceae bacterium]|nr:hypothetical protein [Pontiellaceae bacterium]